MRKEVVVEFISISGAFGGGVGTNVIRKCVVCRRRKGQQWKISSFQKW
jgi:hypothetical protein